jgi:hypothetical protein
VILLKIIVAGSREFNKYDLLCMKLDSLLMNHDDIQIVCGEARGADQLGKRYAKEHGYEVLSFPANWDKYGKSAGYKRNQEMAKVADALVAFWNGVSKGTANMIEIMNKSGKPVRVIRY